MLVYKWIMVRGSGGIVEIWTGLDWTRSSSLLKVDDLMLLFCLCSSNACWNL